MFRFPPCLDRLPTMSKTCRTIVSKVVYVRVAIFVLFLCANGHGQGLCDLLGRPAGSNAQAYSALDRIGKVIPSDLRTIHLYPSSDPMVQQRHGAAAQMCGSGSSERWIFYDPSYISSLNASLQRRDL